MQHDRSPQDQSRTDPFKELLRPESSLSRLEMPADGPSSSPTHTLRKQLADIYREIGTIEWRGRIELFPAGIGRDGKTQSSLLMPDGTVLGNQIGIGLGKNLVEAALTYVAARNDGSFLYTFDGRNEKGRSLHSTQIAWKERGIWRLASPLTYMLHCTVYPTLAKTGVCWQGRLELLPDGVGRHGTTQMGLLMPDGTTMGDQISTGLGRPLTEAILTCVSARKDGSFLYEFEGKNKEGIILHSTQVAWKKHGTWRFESLVTYELRNEVYPALARNGTWQGQLELLPDGVGKNGKIQKTLLMPDGTKMGKPIGIGLGENLTEATLRYVATRTDGSFLYEFEGKNKKGALLHSTQVAWKEHGMWHFDTLLAYELRSTVYPTLAKTGMWRGRLELLPDGIGKNGTTQRRLLMPDYTGLGDQVSIGLGRYTTSVELFRVLTLSSGAVLFSVCGTKESGEKHLIHFTYHEGKINVLDTTPLNAVESFKGYVLDRYVASLVRGEFSFKKRLHDDPLAGTVTEPNFSSEVRLLHSKWGNNGNDTLEYFLKNYRLAATRSIPFTGLVASSIHTEALTEALREVQDAIKGPPYNLSHVSDIAPEYGVSSEEAARQLSYIEGLALARDMNGLQELVDSWEDPAPVFHEINSSKDPASDEEWAKHTSYLMALEAEELRALLRNTIRYYTPYWETKYQLPLAATASFLNEHHPDKEIQAATHELFPELLHYPKAYDRLRKLILQRPDTENDSEPSLIPFSLARILGVTAPDNIRESKLYTLLISGIKDNPAAPLAAVQEILAAHPRLVFIEQQEQDNLLAALATCLFPILRAHLTDNHPLIERWKLDAVAISFEDLRMNLPQAVRAELDACIFAVQARRKT